MTDARAIDVHNRLAANRCAVVPITKFDPSRCAELQNDWRETCHYAAGDLGAWRGFGRGDPTTPEPVPCLPPCQAACDANYGAKLKTGSRPCQMILERAKTHSNFLLVPVNISKAAACQLHNVDGLQKYARLNALGEQPNNNYFRDTVCDNNTSTSEHLTAFATLVQGDSDNYVADMLDKYLPAQTRATQ